MKKTIRNFNLKNKKVIIRVDFNVPIKNGKIMDDNRIKESLPTINYALSQGAKVILMSHLGRIKTVEDKEKNSLKPVAERLSQLLQIPVLFVPKTRGNELENAINYLGNGQVILMENTRFEDIDGEKESKNDLYLGKYWASLGEIFINDAFGTAHRCHASNSGIASFLPSGIGFLIEKELTVLGETLKNPPHPFIVILGGSKVSDKIGVVENFVQCADAVLIGGGMCFTFLKALKKEVGTSLVEEDQTAFCQKMLEQYPNKIILPIDLVCGKGKNDHTEVCQVSIENMSKDWMGLDIGPKTIQLFQSYLQDSAFILWNGPMGVYELEPFKQGTLALARTLSEESAITIIGGGDTVSAVIQFGYGDKMTHLSTGGGASLALMEGKILQGIANIEEQLISK